MLALLLEGTRQLHRYYEKEAYMCHLKARDDYPPVLHLVNPRSSLIVAVLQYLSSLIGSSSACPRLYLVFAVRGVRTFADWKRLWPGDVELLSNAVLLMSASLERRQRPCGSLLLLKTNSISYYFQFATKLKNLKNKKERGITKSKVDQCYGRGLSVPRRQLWSQKYDCLRLGDMRYTEEERRTFAKQLVALPECCARHGLTRGLRNWAYQQVTIHGVKPHASAADAAAHALVAAQRLILRVAWSIRLSIAHVENMHKMHKDILQGSKGRMSMSQLFAASVNERTSQSFRTEIEARDNSDKTLDSETPAARTRGLFDDVKRKLSPMEVFAKRRFAEVKENPEGGVVRNPVRPETKEWLSDEWARCSIAEQVRCEELSELTSTIAKNNRSLAVVAEAPPAQLGADQQVVPVADGVAFAQKIPVHWAASDANSLVALGSDSKESMEIDVALPMQSSAAKEPFGRALYMAFRQGTGTCVFCYWLPAPE